jgi:hypothetical protein
MVRASGKLEYLEPMNYNINRFGASGFKHSGSSSPTQNPFSNFDSNDSLQDSDLSTMNPITLASLFCHGSFSGQMGSIYVIDHVFNTEQLNAVFELGPGHSSQFRLEDALSYPDIGNLLFDGSIYTKYSFNMFS